LLCTHITLHAGLSFLRWHRSVFSVGQSAIQRQNHAVATASGGKIVRAGRLQLRNRRIKGWCQLLLQPDVFHALAKVKSTLCVLVPLKQTGDGKQSSQVRQASVGRYRGRSQKKGTKRFASSADSGIVRYGRTCMPIARLGWSLTLPNPCGASSSAPPVPR
jgi:hypothetical protein